MTIFEVFKQSPALFISAVFLLGLVVGSFLNVVIHRLPNMMKRDWREFAIDHLNLEDQYPDEDTSPYTLSKPASHCPNCKHVIRWYENIPLVSYAVLRGKCSQCKTPISMRYPFVELLTGIACATVAWKYGVSLQTLVGFILTCGIVAMVGIDYDHKLLPDILTLPLLWLGLLVNTQSLFVSPTDAIFGAAFGYLSLWFVYQLFKLLTGKEGMGYGDFKMLAMVGAWFGWTVLPITVLISAGVGILVMLPQMLFMGRDHKQKFAFGPFIGIAGWIMLIWGEPILRFLKYM